MIIKVNSVREYILHFDIEGEGGEKNLSLPESKRFGAKLYLPSHLKMQDADIYEEVDGELQIKRDHEKYVLMHVKEIINPPKIFCCSFDKLHFSLDRTS